MQRKERGWELRKQDMLNSVNYILNTTMGIGKEEFFNNRTVNLAIVRSLEIIGEAAKYAPEKVKKEFHSLEWRKICNMRNIIAHDYFDVDLEIVWEVVQIKIPVLKKFLEK